MFFSWPLLYPYFLNGPVSLDTLPTFLRSSFIKQRLPRLKVLLTVGLVMLVVVRFNTVIHPFTLADNRHYMFYVFRILLRHPLIKYAVVPIYAYCAWAVLNAFGGFPEDQDHPQSQSPSTTGVPDDLQLETSLSENTTLSSGNRVSFVLMWLLATTLSLVTAPLVEPRYFIVPWLTWRLHLPRSHSQGSAGGSKHKKEPGRQLTPSELTEGVRFASEKKYDHGLWLETAWFLFINWMTGYIFLNWGFEWPQEPGNTQRFMW